MVIHLHSLCFLLAPYARPMLPAELPTGAACYDKQLIERLGFPTACLLCTLHPSHAITVSLIIVDQLIINYIGEIEIEAAV